MNHTQSGIIAFIVVLAVITLFLVLQLNRESFEILNKPMVSHGQDSDQLIQTRGFEANRIQYTYR